VLFPILLQEAAFVMGGGALDAGHHAKLAEAWSRACGAIPAARRAELRSIGPAAVQSDLEACP